MTRLAASCLALALLAGPARACINDVELPSHEREFRSQYARRPAPPRTYRARPMNDRLLVAGGVALMTVAVTIAVVGTRARG